MKLRRVGLSALITVALVAFLCAGLFAAEKAVEKGKLYLMKEREVLTARAGVPCIESQDNFCHLNYMCDEGQVARGIIMNMDDVSGKTIPTGVGVICSNPNELYRHTEEGAFGDDFGGKVYREPCDVGFYLAGVNFYTNDRQTISGMRSVCRRYWPVEQRDGMNTFGYGTEKMSVVCEPGQFVTGVKVSYWRKNTSDDKSVTGLYGVRFYCAEMREYIGLPDDDPDPRSKGKHGKKK